MKEITMDSFYEDITELINRLYDTQKDNIKEAGEICAKAIANDGVVHVFGSGHSWGFGLEMIDKVGSLVPIHVIDTADFVLKGNISNKEFTDKDIKFERRPYIADKMFDLYNVHENDVFIIISNSGINGLVIDTAIKAQKENNKVIVVTSMLHTKAEESRHPSKKKLYMVGDVVIDNCGPYGDAMLETDGVEKVCSASAISGTIIAQGIELETVNYLKEMKIEPPILYDEKLEGAKEHNQKLKAKYEGRL